MNKADLIKFVATDKSIALSCLSSNDEDNPPVIHGGSRPGRSENVHRDFRLAADRFHNDYFAETHINPRFGEVVRVPVYQGKTFIRRYRMTKALFKKLVSDLSKANKYFTLRLDAAKHIGIAPELKVAAALKQLVRSNVADDVDEYLQMSESTAAECLSQFCESVRRLYEKDWLRPPTAEELSIILAHSEAR